MQNSSGYLILEKKTQEPPVGPDGEDMIPTGIISLDGEPIYRIKEKIRIGFYLR